MADGRKITPENKVKRSSPVFEAAASDIPKGYASSLTPKSSRKTRSVLVKSKGRTVTRSTSVDSDSRSNSPGRQSPSPAAKKNSLFNWLLSPKKKRISPLKVLPKRQHPDTWQNPFTRPILSSQCGREIPDCNLSPISPYGQFNVYDSQPQSLFRKVSPSESRIDYAALEDDKIIPTFLSAHSCYDAMPKSGKVILLSTDLLVKNAFSCLVTNEIRAAPLWDGASQSFVGMLTITDFINVLRHYYYSSPGDIQQIENQKILTWRNITKVSKPFVKIGPTESLSQATKLLIQEGVHRLPVYEEKRNSVLFVITKKRLLQYLYNNLIEKFDKSNVKTPSFLKKTIGELKLGTWENIVKITFKTRVIDALDIFIEKNVSALPVVDDDDKLIDLFAKFDVFALAKEKTYHNLELTISETIDKAEVHEGVYVCCVDETVETVIDKFVTVKVHRLVVTDGKRTVLGIISLSDILKFLVLQSAGESSLLAADIIEEAPEGAIGGAESDSVFLGSHLEGSSNMNELASFEKEESSDLSEDLVKLQVETENASEAVSECFEDENEQSDA